MIISKMVISDTKTIKDWIKILEDLATKTDKGFDTDVYFTNGDEDFQPIVEIEHHEGWKFDNIAIIV